MDKHHDNRRLRDYTVNKNVIKFVFLFIHFFFNILFSDTFTSVSVNLVETQRSFLLLLQYKKAGDYNPLRDLEFKIIYTLMPSFSKGNELQNKNIFVYFDYQNCRPSIMSDAFFRVLCFYRIMQESLLQVRAQKTDK